MFRTARLRTTLCLTASLAALFLHEPVQALTHTVFGIQEGSPELIKEPKSKVPFESWSRFTTGAEREKAEDQPVLTLTGTGLRTKTIFAVKVYAVGMYVEAAGVQEALSKWKGKKASELAKDEGFYKALLGAPVTKSLRLVMTRDVDGEDMGEAFSDSLGPRVDRAVKGLEEAKAKAARANMKTFKGVFSMDELAEETEIIFTWLPKGGLVTTIDGKPQGVLDAPVLSRALFDIYFDKDPISDKAKVSLVGRVPGILTESKAP